MHPIARTVVLGLICLSFAFSGASPPSAAANHALWLPPLEGPLRVRAGFDLANGPYQAGHRGIDLPASPGGTVFAPVAGEVTFSGTVVDRPVLSIRVDARTVVSVEPVESELAAGATVTRGQSIGSVAAGGDCDGVCLHLGVRVDDAYVNPLRYLKPRPQLLPW